jgi:prepilin-type N-terminal cleavage/methylation domain-containing protein
MEHVYEQASWFMSKRAIRRAFTFIEIMIVVVIIGILAAIVVPRFSNATDDAKLSALKATLADIRGAIANSYAQSILSGTPQYPDKNAMNDMFPNGLPRNPYTGASDVNWPTGSDAKARVVTDASVYGWAYFIDNATNPPTAIFYANSDTKVNDVTTGQSIGLNEY